MPAPSPADFGDARVAQWNTMKCSWLRWKLVSLQGLLWCFLGWINLLTLNSKKGGISLCQCQMLSFASALAFFFWLFFWGLSSDGSTSNKYRATAEDTPNSVAWRSLWREASEKRITYRDFGEQTNSLIVPLLFTEVIRHLQFGPTSVHSCETQGEIQEPNQKEWR